MEAALTSVGFLSPLTVTSQEAQLCTLPSQLVLHAMWSSTACLNIFQFKYSLAQLKPYSETSQLFLF